MINKSARRFARVVECMYVFVVRNNRIPRSIKMSNAYSHTALQRDRRGDGARGGDVEFD